MIKYRGKPIRPSRSAAEEMIKLDLDDDDIIKILKNGKEPKQRKPGVTEKWLPRGKKIYNVVIAEHPDRVVIIHVGRITKTKKTMARLKG